MWSALCLQKAPLPSMDSGMLNSKQGVVFSFCLFKKSLNTGHDMIGIQGLARHYSRPTAAINVALCACSTPNETESQESVQACVNGNVLLE